MKKFLFSFLLCCYLPVLAQDTLHKEDVAVKKDVTEEVHTLYKDLGQGVNNGRLKWAAAIHLSAYAGTLLTLQNAWYDEYPKTSFHTFNDSKEWLQVDKVGHAWTAYNIAKYSTSLWRWTGLSKKKAVLLGGIGSLGFQTVLEYLDAHSSAWGWSWADMAANAGGTVFYVAQDLGWQEQRVLFKFSAHKINYDNNLEPRANDLFGKTLPERLLKDYNGQTYWFSGNIQSLARQSAVPGWLNIAVGYGGTGMFGGFENKAVANDGSITFDRSDIKRQRQWFIAPDVDFSRIKTNRKAIKFAFTVINLIKLPAPTLAFSGGKLKGHFLYF